MLKLKGITKDYVMGEDTVHALKGIDLEFRESEFVAILGHSGCGKTTLLNIIGGLDQYTEGDLIINGKSTKDFEDRDWDSYRNHSVGFVFQSYNLIPHQTVLSNVELALTLSGVSKAERRQRAIAALEQVGLGDQLNKKPNQMSGGQMQRVAIARALVNDPDILLADEPTGALDSETSVQIMNILKEISKDKLIVMVTHNPELAEEYASRIIRLKDGLITDDSQPYETADTETVGLKLKKTVMSYFTALTLSLNNLMTKKGRTLLTAFAGSIGIIGIALILSISTGVNNYIDDIQEEALSAAPLMIQEENVDMTALMTTFMGLNAENEENAHDADAVYSNTIFYDMMNAMSNAEIDKNNLTAFKEFLDKEMAGDGTTDLKQHVSTIQYTYNIALNLYTEDADGQIVKSDIMTMLSSMRAGVIGEEAESSVNASINDVANLSSAGTSQMVVWQEMRAGENGELINDLIPKQYDLLYGEWPQAYDEVLLIVDHNNEVSDLVLYALGLKSTNDMLSAMASYMLGEEPEVSVEESWSYSEICGKTFRLILPADCWQLDPATGEYKDISADDLGLKTLYSNGTPLKIVGVIRPVSDKTMTSGGIGYTNALTRFVAEETAEREIVKQQLENPDSDVFTGLPFKDTKSALTDAEVKEIVTDYFATLDDEKKAEIYIGYSSIAPQAYIDGILDEQLKDVKRADIEQQVVENYPEYKTMIDAMDDETLFAYMRQMISAGISEQYAVAMKEALSSAPVSALAEAFDQMYLTDEGYRVIYDNLMPETFSKSSYEGNLRNLGYFDLDSPAGINIFVSTFADKDIVAEIIEDYNSSVEVEDQISYTDYVALIMSSVTTIINVISYVLIAFVAISLIVSSIMIGIITYISVLERTKEIGILRAIGASKKDISRVFNAETVIVGFGAGLIGILITILLCVPINAIVHHLTDIYTINAVLPPLAAVVLVIISVLLTMVAGLIPSRVAANKDPVEALRTE